MIRPRDLVEFWWDIAAAIRAAKKTAPDHADECPDFIEPADGSNIAMPDGTPIADELLVREFARVIDHCLDSVVAGWSAEA